MSIMRNPAGQWGLAALRIVTGGLFMLHGADKIWGLPGVGGDAVALLSLMGLAGVIELGAGALVALGFVTRPAALLASGQMAVAYGLVHAPSHVLPTLNGGDAALLFCIVFLYIAAAGPGGFSLDALHRGDAPPVIHRRRQILD